ncbi:MAG: molybdopterin oxidoreductase family protein, partial [Planctomycetota bacterium]
DLHLQPVPGGDLCLANGLLYVVREQGRTDRAYVDQHTTDYALAGAVADQYPPSFVEQTSGVSESDLRRCVDWLADGPSMLLTGRGPEQQSKGVDGVHALINLMLALGKVGKPFSGYGTLTGQGNGQGGREHGQKADQLPGYRLIKNPDHRTAVAKVWDVDPDDLPGPGKSAVELIDDFGREVHGLIVMGSNLPVATPNRNRVVDKLHALDLLVVCDAFDNDTTAVADVVLPTLQWAEEEGTMTNLEGRVIRRRKAIDPPAGCRSDLDVLQQLASRLGGEKFVPSSEPEAIFDELRRASAGGVADYSGISYERIDTEEGVFWPCTSDDHPGTPRLFADGFPTPDGKARFFPVRHRPAAEEPDADYPLWFTTGRYKQHYNSGAQTRRVQPLRAAKPKPKLELHPLLAHRLGVGDDDPVEVSSRRGTVRFDVTVTPDIRPDVVFAPFHYGGRASANVLTVPALDPTSRMPEFKVCAVRIDLPNGEAA